MVGITSDYLLYPVYGADLMAVFSDVTTSWALTPVTQLESGVISFLKMNPGRRHAKCQKIYTDNIFKGKMLPQKHVIFNLAKSRQNIVNYPTKGKRTWVFISTQIKFTLDNLILSLDTLFKFILGNLTKANLTWVFISTKVISTLGYLIPTLGNYTLVKFTPG